MTSSRVATLLASVFFASLTFGCGNTSVGFECTANDQCDNAQTCYTAAPNGYCSTGCFTVGTDEDCPGGSVCDETTFGRICARTCVEHTDCRPEYECNGVSGTNVKACKPKKT